jgi:hypothetical protein
MPGNRRLADLVDLRQLRHAVGKVLANRGLVGMRQDSGQGQSSQGHGLSGQVGAHRKSFE